MRQSMTGFATLSGSTPTADWIWDARSVNGRGLDQRFRLPEGFESLEPALRSAVTARFKRGSISISLKVSQSEAASVPRLNSAALDAVLTQIGQIQDRAAALHVDIVAPSAAEVLSQRGVVDTARGNLPQELLPEAEKGIAPLLDALQEARHAEGQALHGILTGCVDRIAALATEARRVADARTAESGTMLRQKVEELLSLTTLPDEARLAQELALLAVKADVTEELDRLAAHIDTARGLLDAQDPVGRRLDFLNQEFLREVNTLCSKSGSTELTKIGLDLKAVIEQMREQVQNLE